MASTTRNGHGVCAYVVVMLVLAASPRAMVQGQAVVTISQPPPSDCPYPCLPPPTTPAIYPQPPPPSLPSPPLPPSEVYPPPSMVYPAPPGGYFPYYFPPPWYLANAPPPPDPILPYFPWYYKHPLVQNSSSETRHTRSWVLILSLLLMVVSLALFN